MTLSLRTFQQKLADRGLSLVGWELFFDGIRLKVTDAEEESGYFKVSVIKSGEVHELRAQSWEIIRCYRKKFVTNTLEVR